MLFADYVILFVSIAIIAVSAVSNSKEDAVEAFTGSSSNDLFKDRKSFGPEKFFFYSMLLLSVLYFAAIIWSNSIDRFFL